MGEVLHVCTFSSTQYVLARANGNSGDNGAKDGTPRWYVSNPDEKATAGTIIDLETRRLARPAIERMLTEVLEQELKDRWFGANGNGHEESSQAAAAEWQPPRVNPRKNACARDPLSNCIRDADVTTTDLMLIRSIRRGMPPDQADTAQREREPLGSVITPHPSHSSPDSEPARGKNTTGQRQSRRATRLHAHNSSRLDSVVSLIRKRAGVDEDRDYANALRLTLYEFVINNPRIQYQDSANGLLVRKYIAKELLGEIATPEEVGNNLKISPEDAPYAVKAIIDEGRLTLFEGIEGLVDKKSLKELARIWNEEDVMAYRARAKPGSDSDFVRAFPVTKAEVTPRRTNQKKNLASLCGLARQIARKAYQSKDDIQQEYVNAVLQSLEELAQNNFNHLDSDKRGHLLVPRQLRDALRSDIATVEEAIRLLGYNEKHGYYAVKVLIDTGELELAHGQPGLITRDSLINLRSSWDDVRKEEIMVGHPIERDALREQRIKKENPVSIYDVVEAIIHGNPRAGKPAATDNQEQMPENQESRELLAEELRAYLLANHEDRIVFHGEDDIRFDEELKAILLNPTYPLDDIAAKTMPAKVKYKIGYATSLQEMLHEIVLTAYPGSVKSKRGSILVIPIVRNILETVVTTPETAVEVLGLGKHDGNIETGETQASPSYYALHSLVGEGRLRIVFGHQGAIDVRSLDALAERFTDNDIDRYAKRFAQKPKSEKEGVIGSRIFSLDVIAQTMTASTPSDVNISHEKLVRDLGRIVQAHYADQYDPSSNGVISVTGDVRQELIQNIVFPEVAMKELGIIDEGLKALVRRDRLRYQWPGVRLISRQSLDILKQEWTQTDRTRYKTSGILAKTRKLSSDDIKPPLRLNTAGTEMAPGTEVIDMRPMAQQRRDAGLSPVSAYAAESNPVRTARETIKKGKQDDRTMRRSRAASIEAPAGYTPMDRLALEITPKSMRINPEYVNEVAAYLRRVLKRYYSGEAEQDHVKRNGQLYVSTGLLTTLQRNVITIDGAMERLGIGEGGIRRLLKQGQALVDQVLGAVGDADEALAIQRDSVRLSRLVHDLHMEEERARSKAGAQSMHEEYLFRPFLGIERGDIGVWKPRVEELAVTSTIKGDRRAFYDNL